MPVNLLWPSSIPSAIIRSLFSSSFLVSLLIPFGFWYFVHSKYFAVHPRSLILDRFVRVVVRDVFDQRSAGTRTIVICLPYV